MEHTEQTDSTKLFAGTSKIYLISSRGSRMVLCELMKEETTIYRTEKDPEVCWCNGWRFPGLKILSHAAGGVTWNDRQKDRTLVVKNQLGRPSLVCQHGGCDTNITVMMLLTESTTKGSWPSRSYLTLVIVLVPLTRTEVLPTPSPSPKREHTFRNQAPSRQPWSLA